MKVSAFFHDFSHRFRKELMTPSVSFPVSLVGLHRWDCETNQPPVLCVRWRLLQADQSVAGRVERESSDAVAPFLLRPAWKEGGPLSQTAGQLFH